MKKLMYKVKDIAIEANQMRKERDKDEDEESDSESSEESEDVNGSMIQFSDYTLNLQEHLEQARNSYFAMSIMECDTLLDEFFKSNKGKFVNYNKIEEQERLKIMWVALSQLRQNIWSIDYIKRKIYAVQCPENPRFKRSIEDMSDISMETIKKLEEIMELFSNFYLEIVEQLPDNMHKTVDLKVSEKLLLGEEVLKRLRKKSMDAKTLFTKLDKDYGNIFINMNRTQCDVKDYMSFYNLLPRFLYVYKSLEDKFKELSDPYIKYATNLIKTLSFQWRERMNAMFKSMQFINFFIIFSKMVFEMVQVSNDPLEILKPLEVFLNLYNMNNHTFAAISNLRKEFLDQYHEVKKVFHLLEKNFSLNSMPFPVFDQHPDLFETAPSFGLHALLALLLVFWFND